MLAKKLNALKHDGILSISVGRSRKETNWKQREISWSDFVKLQAEPIRTKETVAEYHKLTKTQQHEIKDVGGYVGGTLKGGRRKASAVAWRSMLTLDLDFATSTFWQNDFLPLNDYAALLYSTHSHTPENPRLRLIIPLSRSVHPDEYGAISRRVAGNIGIDYFDDTTFQPERLMYHASCPYDGEFILEVQDGPFLDADSTLATYDDWRDISAWPESSRSTGIRQRTKDKQGDPLTKPGLIGAFCRAYNIDDAIATFLPDVYIRCDAPGRYTYAQGSTAAGLVVYDDGLFAYSHHGTDPASGTLNNAFDLVRRHLFSDLDDGALPRTPTSRMPSYQAMLDLIREDNAVKREILADDFDAPDEWKDELELNKNGLVQSINNALIILDNDPLLKDSIRFNSFSQRREIIASLPWREDTGVWKDADDACLMHYMEKFRGMTSVRAIDTALSVATEKHRYHPVRDYFEQLTWDGTPRLETFIDDYIGLEEANSYTRAVTRKALAAAVARIYRPGTKFDYVLTLCGAQGIGKSSIWRQLAGDYLQESFNSFEGKEAAEQLRGFLIIELSELAALRKSEIETAKGFISRRVDSYRVPYGRNISDFPRQCIFVATTNTLEFSSDTTGARRWWVLRCSGKPKIKGGWTALTDDIKDQIWAEAVQVYRKGEKLYLDRKEEASMALEEQKLIRRVSDKAGLVEEYLNTLLPVNWDNLDIDARRLYLSGSATELEGSIPREKVCALEIWTECLGQKASQLKRIDCDELHGIMASIDGWERDGKRRFPLYGVQRSYKKMHKNSVAET